MSDEKRSGGLGLRSLSRRGFLGGSLATLAGACVQVGERVAGGTSPQQPAEGRDSERQRKGREERAERLVSPPTSAVQRECPQHDVGRKNESEVDAKPQARGQAEDQRRPSRCQERGQGAAMGGGKPAQASREEKGRDQEQEGSEHGSTLPQKWFPVLSRGQSRRRFASPGRSGPRLTRLSRTLTMIVPTRSTTRRPHFVHACCLDG